MNLDNLHYSKKDGSKVIETEDIKKSKSDR